MNRKIAITGVLTIVILAACSGSSGGVPSDSNPSQTNAGTTNAPRLQENYSGALPVQGQLAAGTLLLDKTDMAVDEAEAGELLPLWQALQSLSNSDTAAPVEIESVINEIQDTMTPDQVSAIADMSLTEDSLTNMIQDGTLDFGRGFGNGSDPTTGNGNGGFSGGFPGGVISGGPGGGFGGGDFQGGGPGGFPGGGQGGFQGADPEAIATRRAEFTANGAGTFQDRALLGAVVHLLVTKTGEFTDNGPGQIFQTIFSVVSDETGLSLEEIQNQMADGSTLAEVIDANGGDVELVRQALIDALGELPNAAELDLEQMADQWMGLTNQ
jgi:hypothetical protein